MVRSSILNKHSKFKRDSGPGTTTSNLLEGNSIFSQLMSSSFGVFHSAILPLVDGPDALFKWSEFQVPRVVVIGSESAGKSSILENITKCAIFPRSERVCTKMPVVLEMVNFSFIFHWPMFVGFQNRRLSQTNYNFVRKKIAGYMIVKATSLESVRRS